LGRDAKRAAAGGNHLGCHSGLSTGTGLKRKKRGEVKRKGFKFLKLTQTSEFKPRFELNNSKRCTSMYATVNPYISLINYEK
jgi:hypothetical protein